MSLELNPAATSTPCRAGRPDRARHVRRVRLSPRAEWDRRRGALVPFRSPRWPRRARLPDGLHRGPARSERPGDPPGLSLAGGSAFGPASLGGGPRRRRSGDRCRLGEPARRRLAVADVDERRLLRRAAVEGDRAARAEPAARRDVRRVRRLAHEDRPLRAHARRGRLRRRRDGDERLRVRVARLVDDRVRRPDLHDLAEVHHRDAIGDHPRQRQVVGDEQVGQVALRAQVEHQAQQLRPDRDVEHAHRLVRDDELRPEHERPRDDDALALAAGQLVREARDEVLGRPEAGGVERLEHLLAALLGGAAEAVHDQRLGHEVADRCAWGRASRTGPGRSPGPGAGTPRSRRVPHSVRDVLRRRTRSSRAVWRVSFTMTRPIVVLPEPDSPTSASTSPLLIDRSTPSTARTTRAGRRRIESTESATDREMDLEARGRRSSSCRSLGGR